MIEPRPNCFSMARMAASTALRVRSRRSRAIRAVPLRCRCAPCRSRHRCCPRDGHAWFSSIGCDRGPATSDRDYSSLRLPVSHRGFRLGLMTSTDCGGESSSDSSCGLARLAFGFFLASRRAGTLPCHVVVPPHGAAQLGDAASRESRLHLLQLTPALVPACVSRLASIAARSNAAASPLIADQFGERPGRDRASGSRP